MASWIRGRLFALLAACAALTGTCIAAAAAAPTPQAVTIDADGTVHVPAHAVPPSTMLSPEARAYLIEHLRNKQRPELLQEDQGIPRLLAGYLERQRSFFAVNRRDTTLGGVHVYDYTPQSGVAEANRDRVLINLHGGGFTSCWPACAELESLPVAGHGRMRVVTVDYRQGPEHKFPAASEDVAAVYRELLKTYPARNIGIYGCSAGGMLTGMAVALFLQHDLPVPGAIGVMCAGLSLAPDNFGGDSVFTTAATGESNVPPPLPPPGESAFKANREYLGNVDLADPLVSPANSPAVLARFPPTLIVTGTRSMDLSSAVQTHRLLKRQGVDVDLQVWEGMFHGFFYNIDVPESRECFDVLIKFFERKLGREADTPGAGDNFGRSGEITVRRNVLLVGGRTLAGWQHDAPDLFGLPQLHVLTVPGGRTGDMLAKFRRSLADTDVDLVAFLPDISAARTEGLEAMQMNLAAMVDIALANGKRVLLSRPIELGGSSNPEAEESLALWMQKQALDRGLGYGDYRDWPFGKPLQQARSLADRNEALQTALDDAFRAHAGISTAERFARYAAWQSAQPDTPGSGPYPAIRAIDPSLPTHTFYRPANLVPFSGHKLPVLVWGNGGCTDDSAFSRPFLTQIASHGYLVIALGTMKSGPGSQGKATDATSGRLPTLGKDMIAAVDWVKGLASSANDWKEFIDADNIAAAGYSCGGLLALEAAQDPRLRTAAILNSGAFTAQLPGANFRKENLVRLHTPMLYIAGGVTDVAYLTALDDVKRLSQVPVVMASREVGHSGTYWAPNGGSFAEVLVAWLDWQLKNRQALREMFVGEGCGLCRDPDWKVSSRGF